MRTSPEKAALFAVLAGFPLYAWDATPSHAESKAFVIHGAGAISCGEWTADRKGAIGYSDLGWVLGYLTAYNQYVWTRTDDVAHGIDPDGIAAWMDGYCMAHPLNTIANGAQQLVIVLAIRSQGGHLLNEYGP